MLSTSSEDLSPELASALIDRLSRTQEGRRRQRLFYRLFPDRDMVEPDGSKIYARQRYPKHMEFFAAGADYRERCFMAANRVGKTFGAGGYETTCHLTGQYPQWWSGRRFLGPVKWWAAGKTNETTRDVVQATLLGSIAQRDGRKHFDGTGVIPGEELGSVSWKQGVSDLADTVKVRHASGGWSTLGFKSYQQGRGSFEGTAQHGIWLDEEPPLDVYGECLIRTATTNGIVMLTFTPLEGISEVVIGFLPTEMRPDAAV
jgi:phage terminase large subunit-like protein